ncbi:MAG: acyltransferase [Actinobacteria bacterium]|nr:acyltransferase [Actinomycetota bacterium]
MEGVAVHSEFGGGVARAPDSATRRSRLAYLDNSKAILVALIIAGHAMIAYGTLENAWPYQAIHEVQLAKVSEVVLDLIVVPVAGFAMGFFFLMSGLVTPAALARRGERDFVRRRLLRFGAPLVVWTLLIWPGSIWVAERVAGRDESFPSLLIHHEPFLDTGPMWFVLVLLIYSIAYAGWRSFRVARPAPRAAARGPIDGRTAIALAIAISLLNLLIRPFLPAGGDEVLQLHLWQWPQTLTLFGLGIVAARRGGLEPVADDLRRLAARMAIGGLLAFLLVAAALSVTGTDGVTIFRSGLHWAALVLAAIEGPLAVGACLWLLAFAQRHLAGEPGPLGRIAQRAAYGAFLMQGVVLIGLMLALRPFALPAEAKALIVAALGVTGSFALSWLLVAWTPLGGIL